ncbi:MAG: hypothetical protein K2L98_03735 [Bacilli bacterium]|nr:hypothetical protein [Bacilli bacterium]
MEGKLLILCDELPKDYERHSVKDVYFLKDDYIDPDDNPDRLFVTWDAVIPQDRTFIEQCHKYATTYDEIPPDFILTKTGAVNPKEGNIKGSIQEESFLNAVYLNIERVRRAAANGEDYRAEAIDLAVQFPMQATQQFLEDFSAMLNRKSVVRILPAHSKDTDPETVRYRTNILNAWKNQNVFMREKAASAGLLPPMIYEDFIEVYSRSGTEYSKILALPIFGESKDNKKGKGSK